MKKTILTLAVLLAVLPAFAQRFITRTARITFFSATSAENIEAINNESACILDARTGELQLIVPIKSFKFEKALMQEHFNENYMESDKLPKAEFKGQIANIAGVNLAKDGSYPVQAAGKLTLHGVTRDVTIPGTLTVKRGEIAADAKFSIRCADYGVKIPSVVSSKISEEIKITVAAPMVPFAR